MRLLIPILLNVYRDRQLERKCRALARRRFHPDAAALQVDEALGNGEPESGPALLRVDELSACWNSWNSLA
jgi:hypothetical protein